MSRESERYRFSKFIESIETLPYTADQSKVSRVQEGFKRLSLGMRKEDVQKLMGNPDGEWFDYSLNGTDTEEFTGSAWAYSLKRFDYDLASEEDQAINLYFKPNEELYWAYPVNVAGLAPLGGPNLRDR